MGRSLRSSALRGHARLHRRDRQPALPGQPGVLGVQPARCGREASAPVGGVGCFTPVGELGRFTPVGGVDRFTPVGGAGRFTPGGGAGRLRPSAKWTV